MVNSLKQAEQSYNRHVPLNCIRININLLGLYDHQIREAKATEVYRPRNTSYEAAALKNIAMGGAVSYYCFSFSKLN